MRTIIAFIHDAAEPWEIDEVLEALDGCAAVVFTEDGES